MKNKVKERPRKTKEKGNKEETEEGPNKSHTARGQSAGQTVLFDDVTDQTKANFTAGNHMQLNALICRQCQCLGSGHFDWVCARGGYVGMVFLCGY